MQALLSQLAEMPQGGAELAASLQKTGCLALGRRGGKRLEAHIQSCCTSHRMVSLTVMMPFKVGMETTSACMSHLGQDFWNGARKMLLVQSL